MKPIRIWGWLGGHDDGQRPIGLWRSPWQPRHRPRLSIATGSSARDVTHFITSIIQSFVYKCNNSNSCKLFYLDYKSMLIHKLPQTPYTAFPLDWQVWAQENTVYSAFSKCISWWAMDLVGKPNITLLIWNHFHSCHPSAFVQVSSSSRDCKRLAGQVCVVRLSPNWPNTNETAVNGRCQQEMWQHMPRILFHRERVQTRS